MLEQQSLSQLRTLKLGGMADALDLQWQQPQMYDDLSFNERIGLLIHQEITSRENKRLQRLLKNARFKIIARLEDIDYTHPRGLMKSQIATLQTGDWLTKYRNLIITGPTGCGKTFIACALGHYACHYKMSITLSGRSASSEYHTTLEPLLH